MFFFSGASNILLFIVLILVIICETFDCCPDISLVGDLFRTNAKLVKQNVTSATSTKDVCPKDCGRVISLCVTQVLN